MESIISEIIAMLSVGMEGVSLIDEDYGQLEAIDNGDVDMYPITFPAVLIETPQTEWTDTTAYAQKGKCTVRVRLILDCYDDTHSSSGTLALVGQRDEMRHKLHALLQGFRPGGDGALMRTKSRFFTFNHGIKVYEMTYATTVSESVTEREKAPRPAVSLRVSPGTP